jgi:hypothetical protein
MRQLMDWRAAIIAGIIAGAVFLLVETAAYAALTGTGVWVPVRYIASIVMGESVLPPPASFDAGVVIVGLFVHFVLSVIYALILAFIIHRWGLAVGILGGALFGLALFAINYYTFSALFPWFFPMRTWIDVVSHVLYGAVAGGVYELLEREVFVPVEA